MKNVLVVDDEADILKLVSVNLQIRGYEVTEAKNGSEALTKLYANPPSLLVLDIKLPDFTGWELLNRINNGPQSLPDFPVVVMTASISETFIDLESYPRVAQVIIKPFSAARLVAAVEQSLAHRT
jgi:CheY-like chemotaxis protein